MARAMRGLPTATFAPMRSAASASIDHLAHAREGTSRRPQRKSFADLQLSNRFPSLDPSLCVPSQSSFPADLAFSVFWPQPCLMLRDAMKDHNELSVWLLLIGIGCAGCGPDTPQHQGATHPAASSSAEHVVLVTPEGWQQVPSTADIYWSQRATEETMVCDQQDWMAEASGVEVNTSFCNYATLTQPSLVALNAGDTVRITLWWQTLMSNEPADGFLSIMLGDELLYEETINIPGDADARTIDVTLIAPAPAATPILFHVDNHGTNSWTLGTLRYVRNDEL